MHDDDFHDPGDEALELLFEIAGPLPELTSRELAPVEVELRHAWRRSVERAASRRRQLLLTATVAVAAVLAVAIGLALRERAASTGRDAVATLEASAGAVETSNAGGKLTAGTSVTTGAGSHAALRLASGRALRLDSGSAVRLDSATAVILDRGALYVDSRSGGGAAEGAGIEVLTALGSVREVGTQFEVRLLPATGGEPAALRVGVREGAVVVARDGLELRAEAGGALTLSADGALERSSVAPDDAVWEWVQRAAAPLAIEGATLAELLDWAARENGRPWRFAPGVPEGAGGIVLHGTIEGFTPGQALEVVLPGCGLRSRLEGGTLVIEPASAGG